MFLLLIKFGPNKKYVDAYKQDWGSPNGQLITVQTNLLSNLT